MPLPTAIDWPEDVLGCPLRAEYRSQADLRFATAEIQDGPNRTRLVSSAEKLNLELGFFFTPAQVAVYEEFIHDTLIAGSEWFNMRLQTGLGMISHICHLTAERSLVPDTDRLDRFRVSFNIEAYLTAYVVPPPFVPDDPVDAGTPDAPSTDIFDGREVTDPRPTDIINSLTPGAYV